MKTMKYNKLVRGKTPKIIRKNNQKMPRRLLIKIALIVKKFFYVFLDVSGVFLGIFLIWLGIQIVSGISPSKGLGIFVLVLGICAFLIHIGHYYNWKLTRWIFGSEDYFIMRRRT